MDGHDTLFAQAAEKLKQTAVEGRTFDAAQVKVIGLDRIRDAAGANWERMQTRVRNNSLAFIESRIGDDDLVIPCGDGFLVIYADAGGRDLNKACDELSVALSTFYLGEEYTRALSASIAPCRIDSKEMVTMIAAPPCEAESRKRADIAFVPVWSQEKEIIATYMATPAHKTAAGPYRLGYDQGYRATGRHDECDFLALDISLLNRAVAAVEKAIATKKRVIIGFSAHATTLQRRTSRAIYCESLRKVPAHVRPFLTGRVAEIEPGTPTITMADWVSLMQIACTRVGLELHPFERRLEGLDTTRAWTVGCFIPMYGVLAPPTRVKCCSLITRWRLAAHRQGLRLFLDNILDPFLLAAACGEQVDFITGQAFWSPVETPDGVMRASRAGVLNLLRKSA